MKKITLATIKSIIRNGGATLNKNNERVTMKSGYQVSKCDLLIIPVAELTKDLLNSLISTHLVSRGDYLGVWIDGGMAFVDVSRRVATKRDAMQLGKELKQLSVLKWSTMECLAVA